MIYFSGAVALVAGLAIENPERPAAATVGAAMCIWLAMIMWELALQEGKTREQACSRKESAK